MPDLTGLPALDVAVGLSFIFLLLSIAASALQEFIANLLSLRAKVLERGLRSMLADSPAADVGSTAASASQPGPKLDLLYRLYVHPRIQSLYRESWFPLGRKTLKPATGTQAVVTSATGAEAQTAEGGRAEAKAFVPPSELKRVRLPSYIAPRSFALALVDTVAPDVHSTDHDGVPLPDHDLIKATRNAISTAPIPAGVKQTLLGLLNDARGDIDAFQRNVEAWFDDTMARVSGWYKRRTQLIILVIAIGMTAALNANTLTIGERLWRDPTLRATVVQQAGAASATTQGTTASDKLNNAVNNVESVAKTGVPIGWAQTAGRKDDPRHITLGSVGGWAHLLGGWVLTILAVSLGAPFWFDTLSRLSRLRGTGKPETPLPASGRGQPGERVVTGTPPVNVAVQHVPAIAGAATPGDTSTQTGRGGGPSN